MVRPAILVLLLLLPMPVASEWTGLAPLVPPGSQAGDQVGASVELDLPWLAVAAPGAGRVYMYHYDGDWSLQQTLQSSSSGFGTTLALSGDHLAVGAPGANRVLTWTWAQGTWQADTTLTGSDQFGASLAMADETLIVGAPGDTRFSTLAATGSVEIFDHANGWKRSVTLERGGLGSETRFGASVDFDGQHLIVGAPAREVQDEVFDGAIYIFEDTGSWTERAHITPTHPLERSHDFGRLVAISGGHAVAGSPLTIRDAFVYYGDLVFIELKGAQWAETDYLYGDVTAIDVRGDRMVTGSTYRREATEWHHSQGFWDAGDFFQHNSANFGAAVALDADQLVVGHPGYRSGNGATGSAWTFVQNVAPVAVAGPDQSYQVDPGTKVAVKLDGSKSYDPDGTIDSYEWTIGKQRAGGSVASISLGIGTHQVELVVTDNHGQTASDRQRISITEAPSLKASFTFTPNDARPGTDVRFTDKSKPVDATVMTWDWDFDGDGRTDATGQNPTHAFGKSGQFTTQLTVTDSHGKTASAKRTVTVADAWPVADAGDDLVVQDYDATGRGVATLDGKGSRDDEGPIKSYQWSIGGVPIGDEQAIEWTFDEGVTEVRLLVRDSAGQSATDFVNVLVPRGGENGTYGYNDPPDVTSTWKPDQNLPRALWFEDTSTDDRTEIAFVSWDFDADGDSDSEAAKVLRRYSGPGTFRVTQAATDMDGARAESTFEVTVHDDPPTAHFVVGTGAQAGEPLLFRDASSDREGPIVAWQWDFAGQTSTRQDVGIVFSTGGLMEVTLTVTDDAGQTSTTSQVIEVGAAATTADTMADSDSATFESTEMDDPNDARADPRRDAQGQILPGEEGSPFRLTNEETSERSLWWIWLIVGAVSIMLLIWWRQRPSPSSRGK